MTTAQRLEAQLTFLREMDRLKSVIRQTVLVDGTRQENTAEHSWHAAVAAVVLAEYADEPVELPRVVRMLLVHDIVEIDAGDTYAYDIVGNGDKDTREQAAADRLYGLLPDEQGAELLALWQEFEAAQTADARFANAIDQIMPLLHNLWTGGGSWDLHQPAYEQVLERTRRRISGGSSPLWDYARQMLAQALADGLLKPDHEG